MTDYVGQQLGNYRLIRQIGQGGFADVYLGEHVLIKKFAAVKILHTTLTATEAEEFRKEAQTLADLNHPNIVDVYDYGLIGGTPFIIMSYAMNDSLRQRHPWNPQATPINLVPYIKQVADALDYVHLKKLIHRDIKPENMLLGHNDRVLLGDFGIALVVQQQIRQAAAGTIEYMAPEQIKGRACAASDQYSLGIVVYEWLCGVHPFTGSSSKIVQHHLYDPPPPLRTIVPSMPLLVEQVVLKALEKDPQKRFANVKAFATALEQAYQYSPSPSHPSSGTAATPTKVLPGALTTVLPVQPPLATTVLVKQEPGTCLYTYNRHRNFVQAAAWSPNSLRIASASDDRTVQVWDALTGGNVFIYRDHRHQVWTVAWSPDSKSIVSGTSRQVAHVWSATTGNLSVTYKEHSASPLSLRFVVAWSPDGKYIASGGADTTVQVWEATTGRTLFTYRGHSNEVNAIAWSPDSKRIASASNDKMVQVWDALTGNNALTHKGHAKEVYTVAWSPDGKAIASASRDATVQVWEAVSDDRLFTYSGHERRVRTLAWSPDSKCIASVDDDKIVHVWSVATGTRLCICEGHKNGVNALAWSYDGRFLVSASNDNCVKVWQSIA